MEQLFGDANIAQLKYYTDTKSQTLKAKSLPGFTYSNALGYLKAFLIEIVKTGQNADGTSNTYDLLYKSKGTGKIVRTSAGVTNLSSVFTALFVRFGGDSVVSVKPTDEELEQIRKSIEQMRRDRV